MYMWTVGYTVGDMMYIAQTTAEQRQASRCSKWLWVLMLLCFLAYAGYQIFLSYQSYTQPDWSSGVKFESQLDFPSVLVCPMARDRGLHALPAAVDRLKALSCVEVNATNDVVANCSSSDVIPRSGRFKNHECVLFNGNTSNILNVNNQEHSLMTVRVSMSSNTLGRVMPLAVILYSPLAQNDEDAPTFIVVTDTSYWAVLTQEQDIYLDGRTSTSFYASTSSSAVTGMRNALEVAFSYSTFAVDTNTQVVTYDWLSLLGVLGGAAAFACAVHEIIMWVLRKSIKKCCPGMFSDGTENEGGDEEDGNSDNSTKNSNEVDIQALNKQKKQQMMKRRDTTIDDPEDDHHVDEDHEDGSGRARTRSLQSLDLVYRSHPHQRYTGVGTHTERRPFLRDEQQQQQHNIN